MVLDKFGLRTYNLLVVTLVVTLVVMLVVMLIGLNFLSAPKKLGLQLVTIKIASDVIKLERSHG